LRPAEDGPAPDVPAGSRVEVTGVCRAHGEGQVVAAAVFSLLVAQPEDLVVLARPPWWSLGHALALLGGMGGLTLVALTWVVSLRRQVRLQTNQIRQRLQTEADLESRYRGLFENANDLVFTTDLEGRLTSLNLAGERLTGYSRDEVLGRE